jgi:hypothetical protein
LPPDPAINPRGQLLEAFLTAIEFERNLDFEFGEHQVPAYSVDVRTEAEVGDDREDAVAMLHATIDWDSGDQAPLSPFELKITIAGLFDWQRPDMDPADIEGSVAFNAQHLVWPYLQGRCVASAAAIVGAEGELRLELGAATGTEWRSRHRPTALSNGTTDRYRQTGASANGAVIGKPRFGAVLIAKGQSNPQSKGQSKSMRGTHFDKPLRDPLLPVHRKGSTSSAATKTRGPISSLSLREPSPCATQTRRRVDGLARSRKSC